MVDARIEPERPPPVEPIVDPEPELTTLQRAPLDVPVAPVGTPAAPTFSPFPRWARGDSVVFLLTGVDRREEDQLYRTDTIMLANLDLRKHRATLLSIPRDLVVNIPNYGYDRINTVYAVGEQQKRSGGGIRLLRETISRNFGVNVDHWAMVDFNCFRGTVDALGGVTVVVPERIYDPYYPTDDYGYQVVRFNAGRQTLDGERALQYARTRYGDTDFGRMRRQQQVVTALREQALQVESLSALPEAVRACSGMASDLNIIELVALGAAARDMRQSDIMQIVIDEKLATPYVAPSGASVLQPRWEQIRPLVRGSFATTTTASARSGN